MAATAPGRTLNQTLGAVLGAVYIGVGLFGFAITGATGFADPHGPHLLGIFEVNPLHNVVHVLVGVLLLTASRRARPAAGVNTLVGAVYAVVGLLGLFVLGSDANLLALNTADNLLHFGSAAVLLAVGLRGLREGTPVAHLAAR